MRLIVTEKNLAAQRIAKILADGQVEQKKVYNIPVYFFTKDGEKTSVIGLKGHILKADFPQKYANWQEVEPEALIKAEIIKVPTQKSIINALKAEAKKATEVIVSTDFDREGELIGLDAIGEIKEVNPDVKVFRARFSALTPKDIKNAFSNLDSLYINLAKAGETRQDIDLIWGATLTRFISLATSRLGKQFLSVGRVQSPTLALVVEREKERQSFIPKKYWQVKALFQTLDTGEKFVAVHKKDRFWDKKEAEGVLANVSDKGVVKDLVSSQRKQTPPAPFNTTSFLSAAASLGISTARAMRIAENLYVRGYISYPRVDNTVYPQTLDLRGILETISESSEIGSLALDLLKKQQLIPTRGKKFATDHPPIHPTAAAKKAELEPADWKIYELVARRFMATLSDPAVIESRRVDIDSNGEIFVVRGSCVVKEGWLKFYHYNRKKDEEIPPVHKGQQLTLLQPILDEKETQPPARYTQGKLIQQMEKLGLGTKATRHEIIKNLYDRGYIHGDPITPTETGVAVVEALKKYAERITTPEMTAELERDMDAIVEGKVDRDKVVNVSREMLASIMELLKGKRREVGREIREGIREDKVIGSCPNCGAPLKVIRSKRSRKRFVGCSNYPDCKTSYPLPQNGEVIPLQEKCEFCASPKVKIVSSRNRPWVICINFACAGKAKE
jgi:DNA topoisomerase-1